MRVFKSKWFAKFARKELITNAKLCAAVRNAERGIIDADYGGGVIKQRIARTNEGKSGGYRSIIFFRKGERVFFVYGFAKNAQDNIDESDEPDFKALAKTLLGISDMELEKLVSNELYEEVKFDEEN
jgi:hypothetical protein